MILHYVKSMIHSRQLNPIIEYLDSNTSPTCDKEARHVLLESQHYILENGVLYHNLYCPRGKGHRADRLIKQLVVPRVLRNDVLLPYHDPLVGGHQGMEQTYQSIWQKYFWPRMFSDIENYVTSCEICQQVKRIYISCNASAFPLPACRWHFQQITLRFSRPLEKDIRRSPVYFACNRFFLKVVWSFPFENNVCLWSCSNSV